MDIIQKNKLLIWIIIILLILNVLSIGTFWFGFLKHGPPEHQRPFGSPEEMIKKELNLTEEQAIAFKKEQEAHFAMVKPILDSVRIVKREAFISMIAHPEDSVTADGLLKISAELMVKADKLRNEHFAKLRKLCKPEQKEKFDRFLIDMVDQMPPPKPGTFPGRKF